MKKFLLAFLFFISVTEMKISFGQTYHPFPDTLAGWSEGGGGCDVFNGTSCAWNGWRYELWHDTIFNNLPYTLIGYQSTYNVSSIYQNNNWQTYYHNFPIVHPGLIVGAIREDSTKKVWFRAIGNSFSAPGYISTIIFPVDSDVLIYDFNIHVGDTLSWKLQYNIVQAIDSILLLNGEWRRVFKFNLYPTGPSDWIEGIGSELGLFGAFDSEPFEGNCVLVCFNSDSLLYENLDDEAISCDETYTGISEAESEKTISVFPNPATNFITINLSNFPNEKFTLTIYNSNGQQVNHYSNLHSSQLTIPISQLGADGLYFYTLNFDEKKVYSGKFLVQR